MARVTINIELDSRPDRNGFTDVMVRLHLKGHMPARIQLDVKIDSIDKHWAALDKRRKSKKPDWGKWVIRHIDADALNAKIESGYNRIKGLIEAWEKEELTANPDLLHSTLTPKQIAERYKTRLSDAYFDLTNQVLEASKVKAYRTYVNRFTAVNMLAGFAPDDLTLQGLTVPLVERFQKYLRDRYVSPKTKKRLAASSINQYMELLNTVHIEVLKLKGHSRKKAIVMSPFTEVVALKSKSAYRAKFNEAQIEQAQTSLPETKRRRVSPEDAFAIWMLAHLLAGARFSDVLMLRYEHFEADGEGKIVQLTYTMSKSANKVSIPIFDEVRTLLTRWWKPDSKPTDYLLPYLDNKAVYAKYTTRDQLYAAPFDERQKLDNRLYYWNGQINKVLAIIEKHLGFRDKLRMHNARHSFADLARRIMQEDGTLTLLDITKLLGQSDPRMVMVYIEEMERQDTNKQMAAVFNRKGKAKESE